jgi:uncharacterized protein YjbJ (UPF0337 family)
VVHPDCAGRDGRFVAEIAGAPLRQAALWAAAQDPKNRPKGNVMDSNFDEVKGNAKQAAGDLTGDDDLKREGKIDEAGGKLKEGFEKAKDKVGDLVDDVKDKFDNDK